MTISASCASQKKLLRNWLCCLILNVVVLAVTVYLPLFIAVAIIELQGLILSLLLISAISTSSAICIAIAGYLETSKELRRHQAIELDSLQGMGRNLSTTSKVTTHPENLPAESLWIYADGTTQKSGD